jgi:hypothetical protein
MAGLEGDREGLPDFVQESAIIASVRFPEPWGEGYMATIVTRPLHQEDCRLGRLRGRHSSESYYRHCHRHPKG